MMKRIAFAIMLAFAAFSAVAVTSASADSDISGTATTEAP